MSDEQRIARYRWWYRRLIGFYSRPHRERFGESMEQTFNDLCRERVRAGKGLLGFALWMFAETSVGVVKQNVGLIMTQKSTLRIAVIVGLIMLLPLLGNKYVDGFNWGPFDFLAWGGILVVVAMTFELIAKRGSMAYRAAVGIACLTGAFLFWVNAAVGIIGDEEPANAMYLGMLVVGIIGAVAVKFEAQRMSRVMFAVAVIQALVPVIAMTWVPEERFAPGYLPVMGLNAVFVAAWVVSGLLFRHAAEPWGGAGSADELPIGNVAAER